MNAKPPADPAIEQDRKEWLEAIENIREQYGPDGVGSILASLREWSERHCSGEGSPPAFNTPYLNTIPAARQPDYPGDQEIEQRLENILRWNAMAMVLQGGDAGLGLGGHIATYASAATQMEVGFNHFFRQKTEDYGGDLVILQPHAATGVYVRSWLEGVLDDGHMRGYRRELNPGGGLAAYPHPRSMPDYWQVANASMGLSTPTAIYQARFAKYLENRGLKPKLGGKVWCFIGDGETDEPEVLGTINIAAREGLDNLILVVNCNLQRLDGPVRGNGKIIQELEASFLGSGWEVIKVIWGGGWDRLLARDVNGALRRRMEECLDGDYQRYSVLPGDRQRELWVAGNPELEAMMDALTDEQVREIKRGGQDAVKLHAAYDRAIRSDKPVVVLVKTVKGDGVAGAAGSNAAHQKKNISPEQRVEIARSLGIPLSDEEARRAAYFRPPDTSPEVRYLKERRQALGGVLPARNSDCASLEAPPLEMFKSLLERIDKPHSTTLCLVRILSILMRDKSLKRYIVPIVPDEARTFGLEGLFRIAGIFSLQGQHYTPVDADTAIAYREAEDGQILQEGICETGAMASFLAAGTAWSIHGLPMVPFYFFYSIFGFQRVGDMIWACGDMFCRGFLIGGTAGRTTLNGEGLQHQDGHSQVLANTFPNLKSYDPAFACEMAVIVREGIRRMYEEQENVFYYITAYNEAYPMPALPEDESMQEGILAGAYLFERDAPAADCAVHLLGSGSIMQQVMQARERLGEWGCDCAVWSVTSYNELYREAESCERHNRLHPTADQRTPHIRRLFPDADAIVVAATDYMKALPNSIARWMPENYLVLGTDGYGLCETRADLRNWFEVSADYICHAALVGLFRAGKIEAEELAAKTAELDIDPDKMDAAER
ncbi:MAG: pyruvate dehydrogenase (acetyl-transferring), homodimeric type [Gammaproteobacteria bacterium]|nr:pyruvate dehydrogenase (acetyl-transferring), homodimeric type [Gammaproteobacteria bacterium]MDE0509065.1 pyruvate dehydrogenase (acetyl-transferring), homodimeric type [Gammaproteobacteria bacterium]